jgi:uncharacterized protein YidB (DUF937 family)
MGLLDGLLGQVLQGMTQGGGQPGWPGIGQADATDASAGIPGGLGGLGDMLPGGSAGRGSSAPLLALLLPIALQLLQRNGGLEGLLGRLRGAGHTAEADSWVGTGQNIPIDASAVSDLFGADAIGSIAQQAGVPQQQVAGGLAALLPQLVDRLTPSGSVHTGADDEVAQALAALQARRDG